MKAFCLALLNCGKVALPDKNRICNVDHSNAGITGEYHVQESRCS